MRNFNQEKQKCLAKNLVVLFFYKNCLLNIVFICFHTCMVAIDEKLRLIISRIDRVNTTKTSLGVLGCRRLNVSVVAAGTRSIGVGTTVE